MEEVDDDGRCWVQGLSRGSHPKCSIARYLTIQVLPLAGGGPKIVVDIVNAEARQSSYCRWLEPIICRPLIR